MFTRGLTMNFHYNSFQNIFKFTEILFSLMYLDALNTKNYDLPEEKVTTSPIVDSSERSFYSIILELY
ncbi:LOW QUALITY PROTEIN: hypothetical protein HZS_4641 [Henneguya salminicola]|nr:LOW QUALITY PROTEIN: hypothetical protein HZS_4641 [Henneguya salminicola]